MQNYTDTFRRKLMAAYPCKLVFDRALSFAWADGHLPKAAFRAR